MRVSLACPLGARIARACGGRSRGADPGAADSAGVEAGAILLSVNDGGGAGGKPNVEHSGSLKFAIEQQFALVAPGRERGALCRLAVHRREKSSIELGVFGRPFGALRRGVKKVERSAGYVLNLAKLRGERVVVTARCIFGNAMDLRGVGEELIAAAKPFAIEGGIVIRNADRCGARTERGCQREKAKNSKRAAGEPPRDEHKEMVPDFCGTVRASIWLETA